MESVGYLVTGATSGIGYETAVSLLESGNRVVLVARNQDKLRQMGNKYSDLALVHPCDLSNLDDIENIFLHCKECDIKLKGMVHAAGISDDIPIKNLEIDDIIKTMTINYFSFVELSKYFSLKKYSLNEASVVAFSSMAAFSCEKAMSQYASSKAAINAFVKTMSKEVGKRRIRVNAIAPSFVDTEMTAATYDRIEGLKEMIERVQPWGLIPIQQVVALVLFLLSDSSKYITGTIIPITGERIIN